MKIDHRPADEFPQDLGREGFDNVSEAQSVSPLLLEKYVAAAKESLQIAVRPGPPPAPVRVKYYPRPARTCPAQAAVQ